MDLSDQELEELAQQGESDRIERKESLAGDAPSRVREAVCAFANDLPGRNEPGLILIGVRDDGSPTGLAITDDLLLQMAGIRSDGNIVPPPTMKVEKRRLRGTDVGVILVAPSDTPPVRYRGRIWIRTGPRRDIASAQDERILNEKRRHGDQPFDARPVSPATIADLNRALFENEYLPAAFAPDVLEANDRTYVQRLAATKMISSAEDQVPSALGLLVLSSRTRDFLPGAYVQFLRIDGVDLGDPIVDEQEVDGPLADLVRRLDEKLEAHIRTAVDITGGPVERRERSYPLAALQQIVRNAVMHRVYEATNAPVRVTWYSDRIEITSPGGPFGLVREDNFGQPGVADYRNPNLAEAMKVLGFVQRFGVGIATARKELAANGNPPLEFHVGPTLIAATVRGRE